MRVGGGGLLGWFFSPGRSTVSWPPAGSAPPSPTPPPPPGAAGALSDLCVSRIHLQFICSDGCVSERLCDGRLFAIIHKRLRVYWRWPGVTGGRRGVFCTCVCISDGQRHRSIRTEAVCHWMDTLMFDGSDGEVVYDLRAQTPPPGASVMTGLSRQHVRLLLVQQVFLVL